jgi:hypothetical protein
MCLLVEYMEFRSWCRREGVGHVSYADYLDVQSGGAFWEGYWRD